MMILNKLQHADMKKIFHTIISAVALISIASCSNSDDELDGDLIMGGAPNASATILATTESSAATRTALKDDGEGGFDVVWSTGDQIMIGGYSGRTFRLLSGAGTTSAVFAQEGGLALADGVYDTYYRAGSKSLPENQTYFANGVIKNALMHAVVTISKGKPGPAHFRNLCGLLKLTLKRMPGGENVVTNIKISADKPLSGEYDIVDYAAVMKNENVRNYVNLDCGKEGVALTDEGVDFYIALPAGEYSNVVFELTDKDGAVCYKKLKEGKTLVIERSMITKASFKPEFHQYVDLGLPSGLKWATCNIGADRPEDYGDYFAWATSKPYYTEGHSNDAQCQSWEAGMSGYNMTSYNSRNNEFVSHGGDAATANWGELWRTPTKAEQDELRDNCTCTWITQNGVRGIKVTGTNGNSIFLPAAGFRRGRNLCEVGRSGYYWSSPLSTLKADDCGYHLCFDAKGYGWGYDNRCLGRPVRAVCQ